MSKTRILIVDDEADICALLAETLDEPRRVIGWTTRPWEALERARSEPYDLILLDIKMPEISGLDLLPKLKAEAPECAVIVMSAYGNIALAVEAMKRGANDYLEKPFRDVEAVRLAVSRILDLTRTRLENRELRQQLEEKFQLGNLISASSRMQEVFSLIKKVAPLNMTVLITGETGTGKELIARTLHQHSKRARGPFICVNCGGLAEGLLESLLFGHEKGSFTGALRRTRGFFEEADGGSLFLDEIGETSPSMQMKLLRVLQEKTIQRVGGTQEIPLDVRLIAATNRRLDEEVAAGRFRQDLFYRLNVICIALPSLRERREDIPLLARHFVKKYAAAFHRSSREISRDAIAYLSNHSWPGNVRQLENAIERAVALAEGTRIRVEDFSDETDPLGDDLLARLLRLPLREARRQFERHYLLENLHRHDGNITQAASAVGLPRQNFHRKMKQLGIASRHRQTAIQFESSLD